jgi:class 3 adenylate cyclase
VEFLASVDVRAYLAQVKAPTLVLHRRGVRDAPVEAGRAAAALVPDARFVALEGDMDHPFLGDISYLETMTRFLDEGRPGPKAEPSAISGLVTILFTDIEGSTALTQRLGDAKARVVLRTHERIVRDALKAHGGSEVKTMGDGFMASFSSATRALECAIAMQRAFAQHNESAEEPIRVRIGLNAGEPIAEEEDLFGTAVIMAARIAGMAEGGEIVASDVMRQLVAGKGFLFSDRGNVALRGFDDPLRLFEVRWRES